MDIGICKKCKKVRKVKNTATNEISFFCKKLLTPIRDSIDGCDYFKERKGFPNVMDISPGVIVNKKFKDFVDFKRRLKSIPMNCTSCALLQWNCHFWPDEHDSHAAPLGVGEVVQPYICPVYGFSGESYLYFTDEYQARVKATLHEQFLSEKENTLLKRKKGLKVKRSKLKYNPSDYNEIWSFDIVSPTKIQTHISKKEMKNLIVKLPKDAYEIKPGDISSAAIVNITLPEQKINKLAKTAALPKSTYEIPDPMHIMFAHSKKVKPFKRFDILGV